MKYREKYLGRAKKAARFLRWCPFLRLAGLNGSIVRGEDSVESDIDFLIIGKAGRLYSARFFATLLVSLTSYRRHGQKVAGRICLNCYLTDQNPDIAPKDPSSRLKVAKAYKYLIPLIDSGNFSKRFFKTNVWMNQYGVSGIKYQAQLQKTYFEKFPSFPRKIGEGLLSGKLGNYLEKRLMNYQQKRIFIGYKKGDETVADLNEIRLHPKK